MLNLQAHRARCLATLAALVPTGQVPSWFDAPEVPLSCRQGVYRVKLQYDGFTWHVDWYLYQRQQPQQLIFHEVGTWEYPFKWTDRAYFDSWTTVYASEIWCHRAGVLLDTSFTHVAIFDENKWITPKTWLLPSTKRTRLLEQGLLHEAKIDIPSLPEYGHLILYNALRDWEDIYFFQKEIDRVVLRQEIDEKVVDRLRRFPKKM